MRVQVIEHHSGFRLPLAYGVTKVRKAIRRKQTEPGYRARVPLSIWAKQYVTAAFNQFSSSSSPSAEKMPSLMRSLSSPVWPNSRQARWTSTDRC